MIIQAELRRKQSEYEGEACSVDVEYTLMQHTSMSTTAQEYSEVVKVDINGIPADLYIGNETSPEKALIWVDEANQVVFNIQGNISNEDIVHIAQSLILSIPTK